MFDNAAHVQATRLYEKKKRRYLPNQQFLNAISDLDVPKTHILPEQKRIHQVSALIISSSDIADT